jgi:hypothetical protein
MLRRFFRGGKRFVAKAWADVAKGKSPRDTLVAVVAKIPSRGPFMASCALIALLFAPNAARAQVIEYESNGLKYQTETRKGLTVIVTHLPSHVAGFGLLQVSIANGSQVYWNVKPEEFAYVRADASFNALPANKVVDMLLDKASHTDVVRLVSSYENALYGIPHMRSTNGYEQRRQNAMEYGMPTRFKAAATASAIVLATTRLAAGQSTDGAVFIPLTRDARNLAGGHVVFRCGDEVFEFNPD